MEQTVQRHDPPVHDQRLAHAVDDDDAREEPQHYLHAEDARCKPGSIGVSMCACSAGGWGAEYKFRHKEQTHRILEDVFLRYVLHTQAPQRTSNSIHDGDPAPVVRWHPEDGCDRQQEGSVGAILRDRVVRCSWRPMLLVTGRMSCGQMSASNRRITRCALLLCIGKTALRMDVALCFRMTASKAWVLDAIQLMT